MQRARVRYADGTRSGREPAVAAAALQALGAWDECLVWLTEWGVWPSGEDWPEFYAWRGSHGERRSLDTAPGHRFGAGEASELETLLRFVLENGWDATALPALGGAATDGGSSPRTTSGSTCARVTPWSSAWLEQPER